jgi:uncharacterized protein
MIEVDVRDVVVRVAPDGEEGVPRVVAPQRIILLAEKGGGRTLPIWVGSPEGDALALYVVRASPPPRPMTIELMARLLEATGGRVERVVVSSLRENIFYAAVHVATGEGAIQEVDARPSDGMNLAVRVGAPIFVDEDVFSAAGLDAADRESLERELAASCARHGQEPPPPGEWRSLTPDLMESFSAVRPGGR